MAVPRLLPAVIALAVLMTGCGTPGERHRLIPLPWPHRPAAKHPKVDPELPAAGSGRGGYYQDDGPGANPPPNLREVPDAEVRYEPYARFANRPYAVFGQTYTPLLNDEPFTQRGVASWYGVKFHGQRTSSGEPYDMYKMSAAHPTLPIPSYARVTSLESGKSVVVRINDRGPFHSDRVIDVSYTAALKLGLLGKGSHQVEIERLFASDPTRIASVRRAAASQAQALPAPLATTSQAQALPAPLATTSQAQALPAPLATTSQAQAPPEIAALMLEDRVQDNGAQPQAAAPSREAAGAGYYLQLGAFSMAGKVEEISARLAQSGAEVGTLEVVQAGSVQRLYGGPFATRAQAQEAARALPASLGIKPIVVRR